VTDLVPIIKTVLEEFVPTAQETIEMVQGRVCLVDGTITPCWSYDDHHELWSRKHGTTGFNAQLVCLLDGDAIYISDPLPGCTHNATAFTTTPVAEIVGNSGSGIGDKGYQGCDLVTHVRHRREESPAKETKRTTPSSRRCEHPLKGSSLISSRGGSSTQTTVVRTAPTVTLTTPLAHCSSSRLHGVLNNALYFARSDNDTGKRTAILSTPVPTIAGGTDIFLA
jgi:hypothetical protein